MIRLATIQKLQNTGFLINPALNLTYAQPLFSGNLDISEHETYFVPISILTNNSALESIVLYLKENMSLSFSEISRILNRNPRTIWTIYSRAQRKGTRLGSGGQKSEIQLPLSVIASRTLSVLESVVFFLRADQGLEYSEISYLLGKNYRTIWTVYKRAMAKLAGDAEDE